MSDMNMKIKGAGQFNDESSVSTDETKIALMFNKLHEYDDPNDVKAFLDQLMVIIPNTSVSPIKAGTKTVNNTCPSKVDTVPINLTYPNTVSLLYNFTPEYDKTGKVLQKVNYLVLEWVAVKSYFTQYKDSSCDILWSIDRTSSEYDKFTTELNTDKRLSVWLSFDAKEPTHKPLFFLNTTTGLHTYQEFCNIDFALFVEGRNILSAHNPIRKDIASQLKTIADLQSSLLTEFTSSNEFVENFLVKLFEFIKSSR